ncbi:hypothetical protein FLA_0910 [Filimonas lacunae]|nr:hypothetical protein FLA_0910 [Filimonas lacunae]
MVFKERPDRDTYQGDDFAVCVCLLFTSPGKNKAGVIAHPLFFYSYGRLLRKEAFTWIPGEGYLPA